MNKIIFTNQTNNKIEELSILRKTIKAAIKKEKLKNVEFGIIFIDDKKMHELNKEYRGIDRTTDVLTFALEDENSIINKEYRLLGDIYISIDKAREQAIEYDHSYLRELSFLMIHGFLHLLGYDHMNKDDEIKMFEKQEEILNEIGTKRRKKENGIC
ncbi:MAG: rRNA maturation RNase YbeY [Bacilli bacterium]|nr:rRNA maturation RNase YbeY [Bacilli bacterium]